jgi:hypothetical protein
MREVRNGGTILAAHFVRSTAYFRPRVIRKRIRIHFRHLPEDDDGDNSHRESKNDSVIGVQRLRDNCFCLCSEFYAEMRPKRGLACTYTFCFRNLAALRMPHC